MRKRKLYSASEIDRFHFCPEQWRLAELEKQGKIEVPQPDTEVEERMAAGQEYHFEFGQRFEPQEKPASGGCLVRLLILFIILISLPILLYALLFTLYAIGLFSG